MNISSCRGDYPYEYTLFFISNIFTSNARLKLTETQANAKLEAELLLFENVSSALFFKNNTTHSKK